MNYTVPMSGRLRQLQDLPRPDHSRIADDLPVVLIDQPPLFAVAVGLLRDGEETVTFADLVLAAGNSFGCRRLFFFSGSSFFFLESLFKALIIVNITKAMIRKLMMAVINAP